VLGYVIAAAIGVVLGLVWMVVRMATIWF